MCTFLSKKRVAMNLMKKIIFSSLFLLVASTASANITVHDYTHEFTSGYRQLKNKDPNHLRKFILNFELVKEPRVSSLFFDGHPVPRDPRIEVILKQYAKELPQYTALYDQKLPEVKAIVAEVQKRTQDLFGMEINADVLLSESVSETDAVTTGSDDMKTAIVALNMREMSQYSKDELRIVLAHELFHVLQHQIERDHSNSEMIAGNIYSEGWATYASSLVYPGFPDWKYISYFTRNDHQFKKFEADRKQIIHHVLADWNSHQEEKFDKYFSANPEASRPFEPRSGYYIGYIVAKQMAQQEAPVKVALIKYDDFKKQIKPMLRKMSVIG
jgi:hypothetical protein